MTTALNSDGTEAATCRECASIMANHRCGNCGAVEVVIRYWNMGLSWTAWAQVPGEQRTWGRTWTEAVERAAWPHRPRPGLPPVRFRVVAGP
jgi:hypothetical protein